MRGGIGRLGLDLGDLGCVVVGLVCELGFVGSECHKLGQGGHFFAERLIGDGLGGSPVLAFCGNRCSEEEGDEEVGELHFDGGKLSRNKI